MHSPRRLAVLLIGMLAFVRVDAVAQSGPASITPAEIFQQIVQLRNQRDFAPRSQESAASALDRFVANTWQRLGLPDKWNGRCETCDLVALEEQSPFVILRIEIQSWDHRFLVFSVPTGAAESWKLAGYGDTAAKYVTPASRIEGTSVGTKKQTVVFQWDSASRKFSLDEKASAMTKKEFDIVYGFDGGRMELSTFLKYNVAELRKIAEQGSAEEKKSLRRLLADAGADSTAVDLLRRIR